jgi:Flp pilus assembly pilin Flp
MHRRYALTLGCIAFAMVACRGAVRGEIVSDVIPQAIIALVMFAIMGGISGAIADHLVKQDTESRYRQRVAWYRSRLEERSAERK